jgi:hypothetical protein
MSIPQFGIPCLQLGEKYGVTCERSRYPLLRGIIRLTLQTSLRSFLASLIIWGLRLLKEEAPLIKEIQIDVDKENPLI